MFAFGISNHSPDQVIKFLASRSIVKDPSEIAVVPFGASLSPEKKLKRKVLFIVSITDFFRNLKVLNEKANKHLVFLFASPLRVNEILGMTPLDFAPDEEHQGMGYRLTGLDAARLDVALGGEETFEARRDTGNYLTKLIEAVKQGSLLNPLMTFIYTLPRSSHQTPIKEIVSHGIFSNWKSDKIFEAIGAAGLSLSQQSADRLEKILDSDVTATFKAAFAEYRKVKADGKANLKSIAARHNVSDYEMRYIVSVLDSQKARTATKSKTLGAPAVKETTRK